MRTQIARELARRIADAASMSTQRYKRIMRTFASRLKGARAQRYRSAQRFADTAGLDPHRYRKYERGEAEPDFETLVRICELLGIEVSHLLPVDTVEATKGGGDQSAAA